ncbi:MAG: winged helix-turn-helix domain-containing protein [Candidatus Thorarchaeota archaeon]
MTKYRSKIRILVDMMRTIKREGSNGVGPTRILYEANLSHDRLTQYLDELMEKRLILENDIDENTRVYALTEKGREFLQEFKKVERFSEAFGIEV